MKKKIQIRFTIEWTYTVTYVTVFLLIKLFFFLGSTLPVQWLHVLYCVRCCTRAGCGWFYLKTRFSYRYDWSEKNEVGSDIQSNKDNVLCDVYSNFDFDAYDVKEIFG